MPRQLRLAGISIFLGYVYKHLGLWVTYYCLVPDFSVFVFVYATRLKCDLMGTCILTYSDINIIFFCYLVIGPNSYSFQGTTVSYTKCF